MDPGMYVLVPPPWVTGTVSSGRCSSDISCSAVSPLFQIFLKLFLCLSLMSGTQSQEGLSLLAWLEGRVGVWDAPYPLPTLGEAPVERPAQWPLGSCTKSPHPAFQVWQGPNLPLPCCGPVGKYLSLSEPVSCLVNCKSISLNLPASPSYFLERNNQGMKEGCLGPASSQHRWVIHLAVFLLCLF